MLATCSYDMSVRVWDYARVMPWSQPGPGVPGAGGMTSPAMVRVWSHHTEFAIDIDFSLL